MTSPIVGPRWRTAGAVFAAALMIPGFALAALGDPAWKWPSSQSPALEKAIEAVGYTPEELRNVRGAVEFVANKTPSAVGPNAKAGRQGFLELTEQYGSNGYARDSIGDRVDHIQDILAKGNRVWVTWMIDGHHTAPLYGFPGSNKPMHVAESAMLVFNDKGQWIQGDFYGDDFALYIQAGGKVELNKPPAKPK